MEAAGGLTIPAQGIGGSWILKLPSTRFPAVPENEFVMLELARAVGIQVPIIRLVPVNGIRGLPAEMARMPGNALVVQRFDRAPDGQRIHMEDFAQVFGVFPEAKYKSVSYANIASVLWAETGEEGTFEFVRRLVFSVLIGNADMHLKNWSLVYPDTRTPVLSPAYDLVATLPYIPNDKLALTFGGSRTLSEITVDQIRRFTDKAGLPLTPVANIVRETVERTTAAWQVLDHRDLLPADIRKTVGDHIESASARTGKTL
jgi:serine/threonine-protein kinase HipA